jgi:hypothetical protein
MHDTLQDGIVVGNRLLRITPSENVTQLFALDELDVPEPKNLVAREPATAQRLAALLASDLSQ